MKNNVKLKDIGIIVTGNTPKTKEVENYNSKDICFFKPSDIGDGRIYDLGDSEYHISENARNKVRMLPEGSILVTCIGTIGKVGILSKEATCNQQINAIITDKEKIINTYLAYAILSKKKKMQYMANAAVVPIINKSQFSELEIELRPIEEQIKIAEILNKVNNQILLRNKQIEKSDMLIKSQFVKMFGDPYTNVYKWDIKKLGDLSVKITDGVHAKPEYTSTGKAFISVINITKGYVDFTNCKYVSLEAYNKMIKSTNPEKGDILYTKVGATYGIPAFVDTNEEFCLYVSVCLIKPNHNKINSRFLAISMGMPYVKRQADSRIKGIGVPDLHLNQIREFDIVCPPMLKQLEFVEFVQRVDKQKFELQKSLNELNALYNALMQKYFG